ncbi:hypothetical protein C8R45DRAFT_1089247 [Mycena sanguinolenta]|nr:hypothetical protein C8R45DRAFT_1089247 [Mycena sanguinolenta]
MTVSILNFFQSPRIRAIMSAAQVSTWTAGALLGTRRAQHYPSNSNLSELPCLPLQRRWRAESRSDPGEVRGKMPTVVIAQHTFPRILAIVSAVQVDVDNGAFAGNAAVAVPPLESDFEVRRLLQQHRWRDESRSRSADQRAADVLGLLAMQNRW